MYEQSPAIPGFLSLSFSLSFFRYEPGDERLAVDTFEAVRIVRRDAWVLKFLRPHDSFEGETAADRVRQLRLRVAESRRHAELNPLWFDERAN